MISNHLHKPVGWVALLFHIGGFTMYACNLFYESNYVLTPGRQTYGGRSKYLTYLNEMVQFLYFGLATLLDILSLISKKTTNTGYGLKDFLFSTIAFPSAMIVSSAFWILYALDRELIYPEVLDKLIPPLVNHVIHTFCAILMVLEALVVRHNYPSRKTGIMMVLILSSAYYLWMTLQASGYGLSEWPYPFLQTFTIKHHCVFWSSCNVLLVLFLFFGQYITHIRFKEEEVKKAKTVRKVRKSA